MGDARARGWDARTLHCVCPAEARQIQVTHWNAWPMVTGYWPCNAEPMRKACLLHACAAQSLAQVSARARAPTARLSRPTEICANYAHNSLGAQKAVLCALRAVCEAKCTTPEGSRKQAASGVGDHHYKLAPATSRWNFNYLRLNVTTGDAVVAVSDLLRQTGGFSSAYS